MWLGDPSISAADKQNWVWGEIARDYPEFKREWFPVDDPHALYAFLHEDICKYRAIPGAVVMDIGSNCGFFTMACAVRGAWVWAFDPHPYAIDVLRETARRCSVEDQIAVSIVAIGPTTGQISYNPSTTNSDGWTSCNGTTGTGEKNVPVLSFRDALHFAPEWDCVKMDVEGDEFAILLGTDAEFLRRIKYLTVEMHYNGENIKLYDKLLDHLGQVFTVTGTAQEGQPYHSIQGTRR